MEKCLFPASFDTFAPILLNSPVTEDGRDLFLPFRTPCVCSDGKLMHKVVFCKEGRVPRDSAAMPPIFVLPFYDGLHKLADFRIQVFKHFLVFSPLPVFQGILKWFEQIDLIAHISAF